MESSASVAGAPSNPQNYTRDQTPPIQTSEPAVGDTNSACRGESSSTQKNKKSKKRRPDDELEGRFIDVMKAFCEETNRQLGQLAERIGNNLDDFRVFNDISPELARRLTDRLGKEYSIDKVKAKIHRLRTHYNAFVDFTEIAGVELNEADGTITVAPLYWNIVEKESNMQHFHHTNIFAAFHEFKDISETKRAARIDFGEARGYYPDEPLVVEDSSSDESDSDDPWYNDDSEGMVERIPDWEILEVREPDANEAEDDPKSDVDSK
ncbi:hypothetical protein DH2020_043417 [Rehmannia glutinosa]|uniref:Uncharacterized protein n=1 Tax=Rehmannia glutinosa TaxID=99300 RepID=A0ABR0UKL2_REHGL